MKNDRRHFKRPREPLARSDTGSESIAQLTCHSERWHRQPMRGSLKRTYVISTAGRNPDLDFSSHWYGIRNDKTDFLINAIKKRLATTVCRGLPADCLVGSGPQLGKFIRRLFGGPPTGFSESDVGRPPDVECDAGRTPDELVSSEMEAIQSIDDEVQNGYGLSMDSKRFRLCQN